MRKNPKSDLPAEALPVRQAGSAQAGIRNPKKGSALIITLFVMSVLAVVSFGIGQVFVTESRITRSFEDTQAAFYVSQAGLEEALRIYHSPGGSNNEIAEQTGPALSSGSSTFSIKFKKPNPSFGPIEKDDTLDFDTTSLGNITLTLTPSWASVNATTRLQIQRISSVNNTFDQQVCAGTATSCTVGLNSTAKLRIKPLGSKLNSLAISAGSTAIDSGVATLGSVGSSSSARRRLEATVDRKSGSLISIFDYALLSQLAIQ